MEPLRCAETSLGPYADPLSWTCNTHIQDTWAAPDSDGDGIRDWLDHCSRRSANSPQWSGRAQDGLRRADGDLCRTRPRARGGGHHGLSRTIGLGLLHDNVHHRQRTPSTTYTIATAAAIEQLESKGFDTKQAKALVKVIAERQEELATKGDLDSLKTEINGEIKNLKSELKLWIVSAIAIGIGLIKALDYALPGVP